MDCPICSGVGCGYCGDLGHINITQCPLETLPEEVWQMMQFADLAKVGLPLAGGLLDQTQSYLDALNIVQAEEQYWRNKKGIISG